MSGESVHRDKQGSKGGKCSGSRQSPHPGPRPAHAIWGPLYPTAAGGPAGWGEPGRSQSHFSSSPFSVDAQRLPLQFLLPTACTSAVLKREFLFARCPRVCLVSILISAMRSLPRHSLTDHRIFLFLLIRGLEKNGCMTFTF